MTDSDKKDFATAIGAMCASFGTDASKALLLGYWLGLQDLELSQVEMAVARAIRESQRLPAPAVLREYIVGNSSDAAELAWNDVQRTIPLGAYKHIDFGDKLINATIRNLGGWPNFLARLTDAEAEKWLHLEFVKAYKAFANSGVTGEMCAALPGLSKAQVIGGVICDPSPVRIACSRQGPPKLLAARVFAVDGVSTVLRLAGTH